MSKINEVAQLATKYFVQQEGVEAAFDPATFMAFAEIIMELILKIQECRESADDAVEVVNKPGIFEKIVVRKTVQNSLGSRREFRHSGRQMVQALLSTGRDISKQDMFELYNEV